MEPCSFPPSRWRPVGPGRGVCAGRRRRIRAQAGSPLPAPGAPCATVWRAPRLSGPRSGIPAAGGCWAAGPPVGVTRRPSLPAAYGIGLLVTFMALALMQRGQPALLYLVPCTLMISCALALWRRELGMFWTGSGFAKDLPQSPWAASSADGPQPQMDSDTGLSQPPPGEGLAKCSLPTKQPPALPAPEETGARAPPQEPTSPASRTSEPTGPVGTSA